MFAPLITTLIIPLPYGVSPNGVMGSCESNHLFFEVLFLQRILIQHQLEIWINFQFIKLRPWCNHQLCLMQRCNQWWWCLNLWCLRILTPTILLHLIPIWTNSSSICRRNRRSMSGELRKMPSEKFYSNMFFLTCSFLAILYFIVYFEWHELNAMITKYLILNIYIYTFLYLNLIT